MRKKKDDKVLNEKVDFPIYTVDGSDLLNEHVDIAINLQIAMQNLSKELLDIRIELDRIGNQLNLYVNNSIKLKEPFDFTKQIVHFTKNNELCIYSFEEVQELVENYDGQFESLEDLLDQLPPKDETNKFKMNIKQANRCMDIVEEYNALWQDYDFGQLQMNSYIQQYNNLINDVKNILSKIQIFEIEKDKTQFGDMEPFSKRKHELLITQDQMTNKWKWVYVRKKDVDKVVKIMNEKKNEFFGDQD